MIRIIFFLLVPLFFFVWLTGCATTKNKPTDKKDNSFFKKISQYKNDPSSMKYSVLWDAYLNSNQPTDSGTKYDKYLETSALLDSGAIQCQDVDWDAIINLNYWSIKPHLAASNCMIQSGDHSGASYHQEFVSYILEGVFESGSGEHYYDAYEVASWGDVEDILELAGFKTIGISLQLIAENQGFYYVVVGEDSETGIQQDIYFDNIRFINAALGYHGRFGSRDEALGLMVARSLARNSAPAAVALGDIATASKQYQLATDLYLKSSLKQNPIAYLKLAIQCLKGNHFEFSDAACLEFLSQSAELEYAKAYVLLSGLYQEGIWVEKDTRLARDFLEIAKSKMRKGRANAILAEFYQDGLLGDDKEKLSERIYKKSVEEGYISNSYVRLLQSRLNKQNKTDPPPLSILNKLASNNNPLAQTIIGSELLLESIDEEDNIKLSSSVKHLQSAADKRQPHAQFLLGYLYKNGIGVNKNKEIATQLFYQSGNSWNPKAQYEYALHLQSKAPSISFNTKDTLEKLLRKINTNNDQYLTTFPYKEQAFNWMKSSANQGYTSAILDLGYYYENGIGIEKDLKLARAYYKLASSQGNITAHYNYAYFLKHGKGGDVNYEKAMQVFLLADKKGSRGAPNEIGNLYFSGLGVERNYFEAFKWYKKSAEKNYQWAQFNLGNSYEKGYGVEKDLTEAKNWFKKAAAQGHTYAKDRLLILNQKE